MHTAARSAAPRALHALAAVVAGTLAGAALLRLDGPPPLRAAVLQQFPTSTPSPHPTPTLAGRLRPAHFPLALAHARTDQLLRPPTAPPDSTATPNHGLTATPAPSSTPGGIADSQGAPLLYLPAIDGAPPAAGCGPRITVLNVGNGSNKVALVLWDGSSACGNDAVGPAKVECSGVMKPGASWTFGPSQLPVGATAGYLVSFSGRQRSFGPAFDARADDMIADYMCEVLFFELPRQSTNEILFRDAFLHGGDFLGVPLAQAYGGPITATVERRCPSGDPAGQSTTDSAVYTAPSAADIAPSATDVAVPSSARAMDATPYRYAVPALVADGHRTTVVHIQNAALECNEVDLIVLDALGEETLCTHLSLPPGESRTVDLAPCVPSNPLEPVGAVPTSGWIVGTGPVAITVDIAGISSSWPTLASYTAPSPAQPPALNAGIGTRLMAPLAFEPAADGRTGAEIFVQNIGTEQQPAHVRVRFTDRNGDPSTLPDITTTLPHGGHAAFTIPSPVGAPSTFASVRIDSLPDPARPDVSPPPLAAVVLHSRTTADAFAPGSPLAWSAADTFAAVLDPHTGTPEDATRTTRVALPSVARGEGPTKVAPGRASRIALHNRIDKPGFTDLVVYFFDQNGLVDYMCQLLNERQVEYIDLDTWGYVNRGYRGSALVSAWYWEHDEVSPDGLLVASLVDLAAAYGEAGPGDADGRTWTSGMPFSRDFTLGGVVVPLCAGWGPVGLVARP